MASGWLAWPRRLVVRSWLLGFLPINAATSAFGVLLPLWILRDRHGSLLDVAALAAVFNAAVIVASFAWGHVADRTTNRRGFLALNYGGFALLFVAMASTSSIPVLLVLYGIVGLLTPAGTSASNLLILEQFTADERAAAFASFQEMSIVGGIGGVLAGFAWLQLGEPFTPLLYLLGALALASLAVVWVSVPTRAPAPLTTRIVARTQESFLSRIRILASFHIPIPFFPRRPRFRRGALARFRIWAVEELRHELPLILAASFLFNFAASLLNTSYTPFLVTLGLASSAIFLVNFANNLVQAFAFPVSGLLSRREGEDRLVLQATYARCLAYLAIAGFTFVPAASLPALNANAIVFGFAGGAIAFFSTASGLILFRALERRDAGALLGLNSALGGVAAVVGSVLSGVLSFYGSYRLTFLASAAILLASLPLWAASRLAFERRRAGERSRTVPSGGRSRASASSLAKPQ